MDEPNDRNGHLDELEEARNQSWIFALFFSREVGWRSQLARSNSGSPEQVATADDVLSILRKMLRLILDSELNQGESELYLMAYDSGVAEGLCGVDSAVCVGLRKGLGDAVHMAPADLSRKLVGKVEMLGRRHGTLIRDLIRGGIEVPRGCPSFTDDRGGH